MPEATLDVTVVIPCLNEELTLGGCIDAALGGIAAAGLRGEVIVSDNGSTDRSIAIAEEHGARVVPCQRRGYGNALRTGFAAAKGEWIVMGDADQSYDFGEIPRFHEQIKAGYELVMGTRLKGKIERGAMPWHHRWIGNPVLSGILRLLFRCPVSDAHCGLRAFRKDAIEKLDLRTTGMELASEIVIKACKAKLRITEIPITLHKDKRDRPPHLRSFRDGWRHLRFMLLLAPNWLFQIPGLTLMGIGAALQVWLFQGPRTIQHITFDVHTLYFGMSFIILGYFIVLIGLFAKVFSFTERFLPDSTPTMYLATRFHMEQGLVIGFLLGLTGLVGILWVVVQWGQGGFGELDVTVTMRPIIVFGTLLCVGVETFFASFFLSMLGIGRDTYIGN